MKRVVLAFIAATVFLSVAHAQAPQKRIGPSFDCSAPAVGGQPLAQIICSSDEVARAELAYVMAYQALRQNADSNGQRILKAEADATARDMNYRCILRKSSGSNLPALDEEISCLKRLFDLERASFLERLQGDALEEARLTPEQAIAIQQGLKEKGLLANDALVDGVFGPITRAAITNWQRSAGLRETGFATSTTFAELGRGPVMALASSPTIGSQKGASPKETNKEDPIRQGPQPAPPVTAPPALIESRTTFSTPDIARIVETSRTNEIRFNRDFRGRSFNAVMTLGKVSESFFTTGEYTIALKSNAGRNGVDCRISDPAVLNMVVDWNEGQKVEVLGNIKGTIVGDLQLSNCTLTAR